jgi:hypothetical protein
MILSEYICNMIRNMNAFQKFKLLYKSEMFKIKTTTLIEFMTTSSRDSNRFLIIIS